MINLFVENGIAIMLLCNVECPFLHATPSHFMLRLKHHPNGDSERQKFMKLGSLKNNV